ncbi:hypothetical protein B0H11DRAFT_1937667 [Mycena galericulata]|nr:hypothetical protein B0H11DRAFT_1937667 [Mycena galericulata]
MTNSASTAGLSSSSIKRTAEDSGGELNAQTNTQMVSTCGQRAQFIEQVADDERLRGAAKGGPAARSGEKYRKGACVGSAYVARWVQQTRGDARSSPSFQDEVCRPWARRAHDGLSTQPLDTRGSVQPSQFHVPATATMTGALAQSSAGPSSQSSGVVERLEMEEIAHLAMSPVWAGFEHRPGIFPSTLNVMPVIISGLNANVLSRLQFWRPPLCAATNKKMRIFISLTVDT